MTRNQNAAARQLDLTSGSYLEGQLLNAAPKPETDARAVHRATARLVRSEGSAEAGALLDLFSEYNDTFFDGELADPLVLILTPSSARALGDYNARDAHGLQSRIRIAPKVMACPQLAADVLLHEMIHAWANEIAGDGEKGYRGHGPVFASKCNEIGEQLGLGPVAARPRGKKKEGESALRDCAQWPMCVRPEGYYGDALDSKRKKAAEEAEQDESDQDDEENANAAQVELLRQLSQTLDRGGAPKDVVRALRAATLALHEAGQR